MIQPEKKNTNKRSIIRRDPNPPRMREEDLDREVVRHVYDYRILSQKQLVQLTGRHPAYLQRVLRRLYDHHYLDRVPLPVARIGQPNLFYILDQQGRQVMQQLSAEDETIPVKDGAVIFAGQPEPDVTGYYINHANDINRFRIAVALACKNLGFQIIQWRTEDQLKASFDRITIPGQKKQISLIPDSFFIVADQAGNRKPLFLELDRGQMRLSRFKTKIEAYTAYYKTGGFIKRYGFEGFRVLTVVADNVGRGRLDTLVQMTAGVQRIGHRFWFTHLQDVEAKNPLTAPIWTVVGADTNPQEIFD